MSTSATSQSLILNQAKVAKELEASFLDLKELESLSLSCKPFHSLFQDIVTKKKKVSELLSYIFNAKPKEVKKFLEEEARFIIPTKLKSSSDSKLIKDARHFCLVLTRSSCLEERYSHTQKKSRTVRTWGNISPLESAAWCGDNFLVFELLAHTPQSEWHIAADQLQGMLDRKETAENGVYLAPFKELLKAYEAHIEQVTYRDVPTDICELYDINMLYKLWDNILQNQRLLTAYGLQEFCDPKHFEPVPCFDKEPNRSCLLDKVYPCMKNSHILDIDAITFEAALAKSSWKPFLGHGLGMVRKWVRDDSAAIRKLCEVRTEELRNMIRELRKSSIEETAEVDGIAEVEEIVAVKDDSAFRPGIGL